MNCCEDLSVGLRLDGVGCGLFGFHVPLRAGSLLKLVHCQAIRIGSFVKHGNLKHMIMIDSYPLGHRNSRCRILAQGIITPSTIAYWEGFTPWPANLGDNHQIPNGAWFSDGVLVLSWMIQGITSTIADSPIRDMIIFLAPSHPIQFPDLSFGII